MKLKDKLKEIRKKGFTLIELIVVIAVLGILVMLAAPKFLGYTAEAKMAQIQNDIKAHEVQASVELIDNPNAEFTWTTLTPDEIAEINSSNKVLNKKGESVTAPIGEDSYVLDLDEVKSKLKGKFIWTENDEVVYYDENLGKLPEVDKGDGSGDEEGKLPEVDKGDGSGDEGSEQLPEFTPESQFQFVVDPDGYGVEGKGIGYYKYIGTGEEIVNIPHEIYGHKMTSYYKMFSDTGSDAKKVINKVISTNTNITDMHEMFIDSRATSLDLSSLDTSNVTNMVRMFSSSRARTLDLSNFNTAKVTNMYQMFSGSQATSLDVSSFDTSNVTNMSHMFTLSSVSTLDLSNFNTKKVTNMDSMFTRSIRPVSIDLSSFDTSNVTNMFAMFSGTKATSLDVSSFNTAKVTNMSQMFYGIPATSLDLSSFDTSKVTDMGYMFNSSKVTTGYARTTEDAKKFNQSSNKPSGLTFTVGKP